jgi:DNA-binding CsgD family transcriptional regulator
LLKLETALQAAQSPTPSQESFEKKENPDTDANGEDPESLFNSQILTFEDWEMFKHRFEQAYPGYLFRLRKNIPALTSAEERLFLLLKLRFSSQEIADTLGISINGVKKGRQRLRKRLNLQAEEDLDQHILGVD